MIRIAIAGYGNLGKGVEKAVCAAPDMELVCVFTRRDPSALKVASGVPVASTADMKDWQGKIDVVVLCGGSATDLPKQTPEIASMFSVIDSFDTHADIPKHFAAVDAAAKAAGTTAMISVGWDPGLFSLNRVYAESVLPQGKTYTFWGKGVSQGHSDAIRRIKGVKRGIQYTVPVPEAVESVRRGDEPELTTRQKHTRVCYVVAEEGADKAAIETAIKTMPKYFDEYDTTVSFIDEETFDREHNTLPHGGFVMRSGRTGDTKQLIEYNLTLGSNPEFTGSVLTAYARAAARLHAEGETGCRTVFDVAPKYLSPLSDDELRAHML